MACNNLLGESILNAFDHYAAARSKIDLNIEKEIAKIESKPLLTEEDIKEIHALNTSRDKLLDEIDKLEPMVIKDYYSDPTLTDQEALDNKLQIRHVLPTSTLWKPSNYISKNKLNKIDKYIINTQDNSPHYKTSLPRFSIITNLDLGSYKINNNENREEFYRYFKSIEITASFNINPLLQYFDQLEHLSISMTIQSKFHLDLCNLCNLINLQTLRLRNIKLTEIPKDICNLVNLSKLELYLNGLRCLPDYICNLRNLEELNVSHNQ